MKKKDKSKISAFDIPALEDSSAALIDAARDIFINEGVKGLSVRRVAQSAGCTTMAVYSRFKGKDGILGALFDEGFEKLANAQRAIDSKFKNEDRVVAFCRAYRITALENPHHYALMLGQFSGELVPSESSQVKAMATLNYLADAVAGMASMQNKNRLACVETAESLFAFCHGWVSLERMHFFGEIKTKNPAFDRAILALVGK
jgi:AcrR family transcriptional regulator